MKIRHQVYLAATLAAGVALGAMSVGMAQTQNGATVPTNPGFNAKDKINAGGTQQAPSSSPPGANDASGSGNTVTNRAPTVDKTAATNEPIPTQAEARTALLSPDPAVPAIGQIALLPINSGGNQGGNNSGPSTADPTTATQGQAAIGGPLSPGAGKDGGSSGGAQSASKSDKGLLPAQGGGSETTGNPPGQPIGATGQTMPAQLSKRNSTLDRMPVMAMPFRLKDEQLRQIYQAAMNDKDAAAIDAPDIKPATQLTASQADAMRPLPASLAAIGQLKTLKYLKTKNKVLLIEPSTRIVVDEITGS